MRPQFFPYILGLFPSLEPHGFMSSVTRIGMIMKMRQGAPLVDRLASGAKHGGRRPPCGLTVPPQAGGAVDQQRSFAGRVRK
jgi:hypothetical protein